MFWRVRNGGVEILTLCYLKGTTPTERAEFVWWRLREGDRSWQPVLRRYHPMEVFTGMIGFSGKKT